MDAARIAPYSCVKQISFRGTRVPSDPAREVPVPLSRETAEELVRDLFELQRATRRVLKETAAHRELSTSQVNVLTFLSCRPGRRAKDLVAESSLGASGMSRHLAALEQLGHVARAQDPQDGRAQIVDITETGRRALEAHLRQDAEHLAARLAGLDEAQARRTREDLSSLTDLLTRSLGTGRESTPPAARETESHTPPPQPAAPVSPERGEETRS
ncbi:MAG: MarR family winged helix-turn-helix transcriptional regulator [Kocuria sp.]|uniref:MarR family winged helix-turn-helix transcriptional regulator n=1 Tax=Kocuria TaxID=57493 RepID=UPI0021B69151|nr:MULTISPECIES: MarR family winged helix-turn-helix transcriptional regulator [Kocuria]MDO4257505.1 MarR family winged helix-turn-helix transcriptional regulator [Kocuria sp.]